MFASAGFSALVVLGFSGVSEAHTYGAYGAGFGAGFLHPFGGIDHVLAMLGVGFWAGKMGNSAAWKMSAAFLLMMAAGGVMGMAEFSLPFAEAGIALSVLVIGIVVAYSWNPGPAIGVLLSGFFALFHGYAHGAELPQAAFPANYGAGFVLATAFLLISGFALAFAIRRAGELNVRWGQNI